MRAVRAAVSSYRDAGALAFLVALSLLSYSRLYMLRDVYADDNCWLFAIYLSDDLAEYLDSGWLQLRRAPQGVFFYLVHLPYRYLQDPFVVWNTVSLAVQIASPLVLYKLVINLCEDRWLAIFVASAMVIIPLDHVVPYVTSLNYRLGLLVGLASLYLTDLAAREGKPSWRFPVAVLLAAFAQHALTESALGFEPARALLVWNRFSSPRRPFSETLWQSARWLLPFALVGLALIVYKLGFKPYGLYAGMYATGWPQLLDPVALSDTARLFALGLWRLLRRQTTYAEPETIVLAALTVGVVFALLLRFRANPPSGAQGSGVTASSHRLLALLGAVIVVPVLFIFLYAGRPPKLGTDSNHAALMQPGYALLVGAAAHFAAMHARTFGRYFLVAALAFALVAGTGIYFNNLNLDLFKVASARQDEFWSAFKKRFPKPPVGAQFMIDAAPPPYGPRLDTFFYFEDLHSYYELEHSLNRLYRPQQLTGKRHYRVYPSQSLAIDLRSKGPALLEGKLVRATHYGTDTLDLSQMTYVYWRGGALLVNREIVESDPSVPYRAAASKPLPAWTASPSGK